MSDNVPVKWQRYEWSCGAACVVNAFRMFGVKLDEAKVIPVSNTGSPHKCKHCKELYSLLEKKTCKKSMWKCSCEYCADLRRRWRDENCTSGTDEKGILNAIRHFGNGSFSASGYNSGSRDAAWQWLHGTLIHGRVAILCINQWRHWVLAMGVGAEGVIIFDPYPSKKNKSENGTFALGKTDLMRMWWNGSKKIGKGKQLYAISLGKK